MSIGKALENAQNKYVMRQVRNIKIKDFPEDKMVRNHVRFKGRVQGVGFRLEVQQLALRLGLTGWTRNLEDGSVEAELQGMRNKIDFLLEFMDSLIRIQLSEVAREEKELLGEETNFIII